MRRLLVSAAMIGFLTWEPAIGTSTSMFEAEGLYKVFVRYSHRPTYTSEGTAFLIYRSGPSPQGATLYFLTAAHVAVGADSDDNATPINTIEDMYIRYGAGEGEVWKIDPRTVFVADRWKSSGHDFAILRASGVRTSQIPFRLNPEFDEGDITAHGFPQGLQINIPVSGKAFPPGQVPEPWYVTTAQVGPGMSGGPVTAPDGSVIGIVEGHHQSNPGVKFVVPISIAGSFLESRIPGFRMPRARAQQSGGSQVQPGLFPDITLSSSDFECEALDANACQSVASPNEGSVELKPAGHNVYLWTTEQIYDTEKFADTTIEFDAIIQGDKQEVIVAFSRNRRKWGEEDLDALTVRASVMDPLLNVRAGMFLDFLANRSVGALTPDKAHHFALRLSETTVSVRIDKKIAQNVSLRSGNLPSRGHLGFVLFDQPPDHQSRGTVTYSNIRVRRHLK